ncbi:hypothetical protein KQH49_08745 [Mycetohabitans sp. B5]|uniref:Contractile injection system tube protein N-terminal domain-containing protein n=1 Tax=Mycetohabitans endofungorum TaxID=417203 RepID=A0A2P5K759_9BURK|nr:MULTISPECIES: hypothetical protein [Mycetohabitans]MCG1055035.1 hypothetical protein [Mycetohabitans sp. B5]PPB81909.1 hypothetical protein B0O95_11825 [Mycetohabitans endofungorum]
MSVLDSVTEGGLAQLKLTAYLDRELKQEVGSLEVMYNPESLELTYEAEYEVNEALNDRTLANSFKSLRPGQLSVPLLFDGTLPGNDDEVDKQLGALRTLCGVVDGRSHETRFLKVTWGKLSWYGDGYFAGRMTRLSVRYTLFDRKGAPLRASATLELLEDKQAGAATSDGSARPMRGAGGGSRQVPSVEQRSLRAAGMGRASARSLNLGAVPDGPLSVVHVSDRSTLPLIAARSPGRLPIDYLALAYINNLDTLSAITPGDTLLWPDSSPDTVAPNGRDVNTTGSIPPAGRGARV